MALGTRILIVEDDADIREGLSELLSDEGFDVATASNGQDAMEWLRDHRPESCVILLDLMMPVMDGRTFLQAKQSEPDLSTLPVVIVTAGRTEFDETPDVRGCIPKPIDLPCLFNALAACSTAPSKEGAPDPRGTLRPGEAAREIGAGLADEPKSLA